ncbi:pentapeptide repeat-containing protein [bacterium]|nr:pentapeptide repeat-containing protein [bacterium]
MMRFWNVKVLKNDEIFELVPAFFSLLKRLDSPGVRKVLYLVLAIEIIGLTVVFLWKIPELQVFHLVGEISLMDRTVVEDTYRKTLIQGCAALVVITGLYFTWRRIEVSEEDQYTDRFTEAINLLRSTDLHSRLGGIYALERIAKDSQKDRWTIIEFLCGFVRHPPVEQSEPLEISNENEENHKSNGVDVHTAVVVLGRLSKARRKSEDPLKLAGANLERADLRKADLSKADLWKGRFTGATLSEATLAEANLWQATFTGAFLKKTNLTNGKLLEADLSHAKLGEAILDWANCYDADFRNSDLTKAKLREASLIKADFEGAILNEANLIGADLREAKFTHAKLNKAILSGANLLNAFLDHAILEEANLTQAIISEAYLPAAVLRKAKAKGANFTGSNMNDTDLREADFTGANFTSADLNRAKLAGAIFKDADFEGVDFTKVNLSGVDLSNAKNVVLPDPPSHDDCEH